jgi:DegV family protein with EDD domain
MASVQHFKTFSTHPACRIIVDSTSAVTDELAAKLGVDVVQFPFVMADGEHWDDQFVTVPAKEFYGRMRAGERVLTSAIPTGTFVEIFRACAQDGVPAIYLSLTGGLSSSVNDARQAAALVHDEHPDFQIRVIDSCTPSLTASLLAEGACRRRDEGMPMNEVADWVEANKHRVHGYFTLETLDWLVAGGRVPKAAASVSAVLGMKADLTYDLDGSLTLTGVSRGRKKALRGLVKKFEELYRGTPDLMIGIVDADDPEAGQAVEDMVREKLGEACPHIQHSTLDPTIGAHVGPGMVALAFWGPDRAEAKR